MTWVAVAVGASAAIGAGTSAFMGSQQAGAAKDAANLQFDALLQSLGTQTSTRDLMMQYFDPFRQQGITAGNTLQTTLQSPEQLANSRAQQRLGMQSQLDTLNSQYKEMTDNWSTYFPILTGANASERRQELALQTQQQTRDQISTLQNQLSAFDKQTDLLTSQAQQAQKNGPFGDLTQNPIFNAQANAVDRRLASQGLLGSRAAIAAEGTVASNTAQIMLGGLNNLQQTGASGTASLASGIGQIGLAMGNTQAQMGQVQGQGVLNASTALANGYTGAASQLNSGASNLLNYNLFSSLFSKMNTGGGGGTGPGAGQAGTFTIRPDGTPGGWQPINPNTAQPLGMGS